LAFEWGDADNLHNGLFQYGWKNASGGSIVGVRNAFAAVIWAGYSDEFVGRNGDAMYVIVVGGFGTDVV
jgi:hypothetical protein